MQNRIDTAFSAKEAQDFKSRLNAQGYPIHDFGAQGYCSEVDGMQVVRVVRADADTYHVAFNERMFPDV